MLIEEVLVTWKFKGQELLVSNRCAVWVDKIPMQDEYDDVLDDDTDLDKIVIELGELNELSYNVLIFTINNNSSVGNVPFELVTKAKSLEFPEGN